MEIDRRLCYVCGGDCLTDRHRYSFEVSTETDEHAHVEGIMCEQCQRASNRVETCTRCSVYGVGNEMFERVGGRRLCRNCVEAIVETCADCGDRYVGHCSCSGDREPNTTTTDYVATERGRVIQNTRRIGIEVECYTRDPRAIARNLPREFGISGDGSISPEYGEGVEIQTPIIAGKKAEESIAKISDALKAARAGVNHSTGLHVHVDMSDYTDTQLPAFVRLYAALEPSLMMMVPASRRTNRYCQPLLSRRLAADLITANTRKNIERAYYETNNGDTIARAKTNIKDGSRYCAANIHLLLARKRVEFRGHSGTVDATKMLHWCAIVSAIVERARTMSRTEALRTFFSLVAIADPFARLRKAFDLLPITPDTKQYAMQRAALFAVRSEASPMITSETETAQCAA